MSRAVVAGALCVAALACAAALLGTRSDLGGQQQVAFPHSAHEGLFPLCTGCHEGVPTGDVADMYPEPASCAGCHDGVREPTVTWVGPTERASNVVFDHAGHAADLAAAGDPAQDCAACHIPTGAQRMSVVDAVQLGTCWACHAHPANDHVVDADCTSCHVSLGETRFDVARIESLPLPADHREGAFLAGEHGSLLADGAARCATCHTQERCLECHVDAAREEIVAFPAAPPGMGLPVGAVHYNVPASHTDRAFLETHGLDASTETCATCHTANDCVSCHVQPAPAVITALPHRADVVAPGAMVEARAPESHGRMFFSEAHATLAAADGASCATCHEERYCVACHDAPLQGGYHPQDFLSRHTASAFGRDAECSTCHSTQVFCRECHLQVGLTPPGGGRLGPGYHDDGPLWLIRHGQGARQNLESCASCHRQVDCTQCHGVLGAFRVSPHSSGFDAERAWARSPRTCLGCHIGDPLRGN